MDTLQTRAAGGKTRPAEQSRFEGNGEGSEALSPDLPYAHAVLRLAYGRDVSERTWKSLPPVWAEVAEFVKHSNGYPPERRLSEVFERFLANPKGKERKRSAQTIGQALREAKARYGEPDDEAEDDPPDDEFAGLSNEDLGIVPLSSVKCQPVRWSWPYRFAKGGLSMMAGDGGIGKSQLLLWIASAITNGTAYPDGSGNAPVGDVLIVSAEDRPDDTIKPRLMAMGADINRIAIIKAQLVIRKPGKSPVVSPMSFQDRPYWKAIFRKFPECRLFIVDPLPSYLG
jgi:hypothetical protein